MQTKQISKKCYRFNIKSLPTTRNIKHSWPLQRNIQKSHSLYPYDAFKSTNRYRYKLSSFCKLILCSSCTVVCLKIVVWVCDMNPAVYLKWVLTNHPHVSSWSETSLCVAVAGTIPFFISLWCQRLLMAAFDTLEGGTACHCLFLFFLGEFLRSICAISVNWLWFDCRVLLSVENIDRWCIELRWLIRKRTVDVLPCDCLHNILFLLEAKTVRHLFRFISQINAVLSSIFFLKHVTSRSHWTNQCIQRNEPHCFFQLTASAEIHTCH